MLIVPSAAESLAEFASVRCVSGISSAPGGSSPKRDDRADWKWARHAAAEEPAQIGYVLDAALTAALVLFSPSEMLLLDSDVRNEMKASRRGAARWAVSPTDRSGVDVHCREGSGVEPNRPRRIDRLGASKHVLQADDSVMACASVHEGELE